MKEMKKKVTLNEVFNVKEDSSGDIDVRLDLTWWKVIREILDLGSDYKQVGIDLVVHNKMENTWDSINDKIKEYIGTGELPDVDSEDWTPSGYQPTKHEAYVLLTPSERQAITTAFEVAPQLLDNFYADERAIKQAQDAFMSKV